MRNPYLTCRKRSRKPLSRNKRATLNEKLFEATLVLDKWFAAYMADLHSEAGMKRNEADLAELREMVKDDTRTNDTRLVSISRTTR